MKLKIKVDSGSPNKVNWKFIIGHNKCYDQYVTDYFLTFIFKMLEYRKKIQFKIMGILHILLIHIRFI